MLSTCRNAACTPCIPWMESSTLGSVHCISPVSPGAGSYFRLSTRGRRISAVGASTFLIKAGFDFKHRCSSGHSHSPVWLQGLENSRCAVSMSWLGWSCRRSSGKLRSSSVKSQVLLLQAELRSWRLVHVSNNSLDLPRKMTLDAAKSCQLFPPCAARQLFSCFQE